MSNDRLVPRSADLAARRGFIRTASQSLAMGFVIPAGVTFAYTQDFLSTVLVGLGGLVAIALANGAQSYFSILSNGIPEDYAPAQIPGGSVVYDTDPTSPDSAGI